jgi:tRNA-dihydrouridine synthase B
LGWVLGARAEEPTLAEVLKELSWVMERAAEHLGPDRAARYLRRFYPWYVKRLGLEPAPARDLQDALQRTGSLEQARTALALSVPAAARSAAGADRAA